MCQNVLGDVYRVSYLEKFCEKKIRESYKKSQQGVATNPFVVIGLMCVLSLESGLVKTNFRYQLGGNSRVVDQ